MESTLNQIYQLEKEMLEQKSKYEMYLNNEVVCTQNIRIFEYSLAALREEQEGRAVYQPLGKAFLRRDRGGLCRDLEELLESNQKSLEESRRLKEHFESKKGELERQVTELTRGLKLA